MKRRLIKIKAQIEMKTTIKRPKKENNKKRKTIKTDKQKLDEI